MYGWVWKRLPGPTWARIAVLCALVPAVVIALFQWVFPWIAPLLPFSNTTVGG